MQVFCAREISKVKSVAPAVRPQSHHYRPQRPAPWFAQDVFSPCISQAKGDIPKDWWFSKGSKGTVILSPPRETCPWCTNVTVNTYAVRQPVELVLAMARPITEDRGLLDSERPSQASILAFRGHPTSWGQGTVRALSLQDLPECLLAGRAESPGPPT